MQEEYVDYILELLSEFDNITVKKMFGSHSLYKDGIIFAIIDNNELYFKVNEETKSKYEELNSEAFTYTRNNKTISMCYWKVPAQVLDDQELFNKWAEEAFEVSMNYDGKTQQK